MALKESTILAAAFPCIDRTRSCCAMLRTYRPLADLLVSPCATRSGITGHASITLAKLLSTVIPASNSEVTS